jgi:hypothetical protein
VSLLSVTQTASPKHFIINLIPFQLFPTELK